MFVSDTRRDGSGMACHRALAVCQGPRARRASVLASSMNMSTDMKDVRDCMDRSATR